MATLSSALTVSDVDGCPLTRYDLRRELTQGIVVDSTRTKDSMEAINHRIAPHLEEARGRLLAEGMLPDRISIKIHAV
jgi:hypothetical protein